MHEVALSRIISMQLYNLQTKGVYDQIVF